MENKNAEFDVTAGGTENVPNEITVGQFAQARCREILALSEVIDNPQKTNLVYQRLPKHMQRRAMSHNSKRLPRRLREIHKQQRDNLKLPSATKRPSRKYRRRPRNLLSEYNRRKRSHTWLETHIWHAKRFHMIQKWGYVLPNRPSDKSFRACYRAATSHCALQDVSFFCCFELCGPQDKILEGLQQHSSTDCGLTFAARAFLAGDREGSVFFFRNNSYPNGAIGKVSFIWKPLQESATQRVIWIWCHPAFYTAVLSELQSTFCLLPSSLTDVFCDKDSIVTLNLLKDKLNRFKLTGPLSQSVLTQALLPVTPTTTWDLMKTVASPFQIPPHVVLGVDVHDPRLSLPARRSKALPDAASLQQIHKFPDDCYKCNIWDKEVRDKATASKLSTFEVSSIHARNIVPSIEGNSSSPGEPIPLMLIHQPGGTSGANCGWDIIIPSGYAMPVWISLIFRGARACGLRDMKAIELINSDDTFPPDTEAGYNEAICSEKELKEKYFRKPPNKRPNFMKLGITSPFTCSWDILVKEWTSKERSVTPWYVIRGKQMHHDSCLVPVTVAMNDRGRPAPFAIICIPFASDVKTKVCPVEPPHTDTRQAERKDIVTAHRTLLRRLKRNRKNGQNETENQSTEHVLKHKETLQSLWLPQVTGVKNSCARPVMGFLTKGDFCFTQACGVGQGYVILAGLKELHKQKLDPWVLVRNSTTRQYRLGKLQYSSLCLSL